jgi:hypothetical protein
MAYWFVRFMYVSGDQYWSLPYRTTGFLTPIYLAGYAIQLHWFRLICKGLYKALTKKQAPSKAA